MPLFNTERMDNDPPRYIVRTVIALHGTVLYDTDGKRYLTALLSTTERRPNATHTLVDDPTLLLETSRVAAQLKTSNTKICNLAGCSHVHDTSTAFFGFVQCFRVFTAAEYQNITVTYAERVFAVFGKSYGN